MMMMGSWTFQLHQLYHERFESILILSKIIYFCCKQFLKLEPKARFGFSVMLLCDLLTIRCPIHRDKIRKKCNLYVEAAALFASDDRIKAFVKIFRMLILAFDVIVDSSAHNIFCTIFPFLSHCEYDFQCQHFPYFGLYL